MSGLVLDPVFYDFEASGLYGFPIEVGWAYVQHRPVCIASEGYLIRPALDWSAAETWDDEAEQLHGLTLDLLLREGKPPATVALRMNEALKGRSLFADSPFDEAWLSQLFDAAGLSPAFQVRRTSPEVLARQFAAGAHLPSTAVDQAMARAAQDYPKSHRAIPDACRWAAVWLYLVDANRSD